jgi:hypothetical protein
MQQVLALLLGVGLVSAQQRTCEYNVNIGPHTSFLFNLTDISSWTLEFADSTDEFNYYYTPCRNGLRCRQGNADYYANVAQLTRGQNVCDYYLSVDNRENPIYSYTGASFMFSYSDGELCAATQEPRRTTIFYQCAEGGPDAYLQSVQENNPCDYVLSIESNKACIPENTLNANCQYRIPQGPNQYVSLDLSTLKTIDPLRFDGINGYRAYYSPCSNGLSCYQQTGTRTVMAALDNTATGTCERYLAVWEDGEHQPVYTAPMNGATEKFEFRFYNGEPCESGSEVSESRFTYVCDTSVDTAQTINVTRIGSCRYDYYIGSKLACSTSYDEFGRLLDTITKA